MATGAISKTELGLECPICMEDMKEAVVTTPCTHVFHRDCLVRALDTKDECPLCKKVVTTAGLVENAVIPKFLELIEEHEALKRERAEEPGGAAAPPSPPAGEGVRPLPGRVGVAVPPREFPTEMPDCICATLLLVISLVEYIANALFLADNYAEADRIFNERCDEIWV